MNGGKTADSRRGDSRRRRGSTDRERARVLLVGLNGVNNTGSEHRMVAPFRGAHATTYLLGGGGANNTTFSRYAFDGQNPVPIDFPGGQSAEGFDWVLVNGVPVVAEGEHTGALPGRVLRRG